MAGDLSTIRVIGQKVLGPIELTLSLGTLLDPSRKYLSGEAAAQLGFRLPFLPSLKMSVDALARGIPAYVHRSLLDELGGNPLRPHGAIGVGISYQPHARVDFGVSALWGFGGLAPTTIVLRFAVISIGKTYAGRAATPLTELGADLAAAAAEKAKEAIEELLKETYEETPIDPKLDESCFIRDDDGSIMGRFGKRTSDGRFCEKDGAKVPIGQELWRDKSGDRLCKESRHNPRTHERELYDCVLWRHEKEWEPAHQARLTEQCALRDSDGRLLGQLGVATAQGSRCRYPVERDNGKYGRYTDYQEQPRDKIFYTDSERSRICETPNLLRCFLAPAEGRSSLKMEPEERFARGADRAERNREQSLKQSGEALEDLATGKVSLTTIKEEIVDKTRKVAETVSDKEKLKEYAKGRVTGWLKGIEEWSKKRSDDQLDDAGEVTTGAVIDGAVGLGMGATGRVVGELAEGVEGLRQTGKVAKRARQLEKTEEAARAKGGVYILRDPRSGEVMRTGRTNDHDRRRSEHERHPETKPLKYEPVHEVNDKNARRGLEQLLHDEHQPPLDKIRPISPANPNRDKYLKAARSHLKNQKEE